MVDGARGDAVSAADVRAAAERIRSVVHRTPLVSSSAIDELLDAKVLFKPETFQRGGSFKLRGAYNKLASLPASQLADGVVASSSGNHAQAVAIAARLVGTHSSIVMPLDAVPSKLEATRGYGATIVPCDRSKDDLEERATAIAAKRRVPLVHPFDDPLVIAGQGTVALELLEDAAGLDVLLVPVGGGGLLSGCAVITKSLSPTTKVIGIEPVGADDTKQSFEAGERIRLASPRSIADGQLVPCPGELPFTLMQEFVDEILLVEDADILRAMVILFERMKIVAEPSGASAFGAALANPDAFAGQRLGIVISGGNVDSKRFAELVQSV